MRVIILTKAQRAEVSMMAKGRKGRKTFSNTAKWEKLLSNLHEKVVFPWNERYFEYT